LLQHHTDNAFDHRVAPVREHIGKLGCIDSDDRCTGEEVDCRLINDESVDGGSKLTAGKYQHDQME